MNPLVYIIAGIVFLAALTGAYMKVHGDGVTQGKAEVQTMWDAANRKAQAEEAARLAAADLTAKTAAAELAAAQHKADTFEAKWNIERKKHDNNNLAGCSESPKPNATGTAGTQPSTPTVRFSGAFLRDWNAGWTNEAGEPLYPDSPPAASYPDDALTSVGPGEVLDQQHADAVACSTNARNLNSLIGQIEKLQAGWH